MKRKLVAATSALMFLGPTLSFGQTGSVPEEVRALAVLCSTGASIEFRGQIEGGLNRIFGKVVEGSGDFSASKNETDFLNSFENDALKIEARKVYNECALGALQILYNRKSNQTLGSEASSIIVPSLIAEVKSGQRFAARPGDSYQLERNGLIFVKGDSSVNENSVVITLSANGMSSTRHVEGGDIAIVPNERCRITYYNRRQDQSNQPPVFSFLYECD